jgi:LDH2 family malate/lactate/ureidoglycolate dehydrogenase
MAADEGLIGMVSQQARATFAPWGGTQERIGASPVAFVAAVEGMFPFYYDASFASITRAAVKACLRQGRPLPEGVAMDKHGNPTTDPQAAWEGLLMPIGAYKGVGLAMVFEILSSVLAGGIFSADIPSIVSTPTRSADSSVFMLVIDPQLFWPEGKFPRAMKRYVDYLESSSARDPASPPRYPGRREGETWQDRSVSGIPLSPEGLGRLNAIARSLGLEPLEETGPSAGPRGT